MPHGLLTMNNLPKRNYITYTNKLFTIIRNKNKYICRVLYETSLREKNAIETFICTYSNFRVTIVMIMKTIENA